MERPAVLTNSTLVTLGAAVGAIVLIVGAVIYIETRYATKDNVKENNQKIELRIEKIEGSYARQDQMIQDLMKDSAVFKAELTSNLRYLVDSVDELKKSVKELSQLRTTN